MLRTPKSPLLALVYTMLILAWTVLAVSAVLAAPKEARQLFGGASNPTQNRTATAYGGYAKGCLAGAVRLPESGPHWQAMRLSRNRNWGHPNAISFIKTLARKAADQPGWNGLYIGDISQPRGGPMISGHRSHQLGLDIDIWMRRANNLTLSKDAREAISSVSMRRKNGAFINKNWTPAHQNILKVAEETWVFLSAKGVLPAKEVCHQTTIIFRNKTTQICNLNGPLTLLPTVQSSPATKLLQT